MNHILDLLINGTANYTVRHHLGPGTTLIVVLGVLLTEIFICWLLLVLTFTILINTRPIINLLLRRLGIGRRDSGSTFLELTFPSTTTKSAYATEQLHTLLRHHTSSPGKWHRIAAYKQTYSLELYATKDSGIRYVIAVPQAEEEYVVHSIRSYLPGIKIRQNEDYLTHYNSGRIGVIELGFCSDFVLPLKEHKVLEEHDLMAYLTGHMTKLDPDVLIGYQIITTPVYSSTHHRVFRHVNRIIRRISLGKEVSTKLVVPRSMRYKYIQLLWYPLLRSLLFVLTVTMVLIDILHTIISLEHELPRFLRADKDKLPIDDPYAVELNQSIKTKLDQPLHEVSIRVLMAATDGGQINRRFEALTASFQSFDSPYQSIRQLRGMSLLGTDKKLLEYYKARTLSPHFPDQQTILSSSELSDLYHFPYTDLTKTEGLVKSRSMELPAPLSIKQSDAKLDVVVGVNEHGGDSQPIGMTLGQRQKHTYVIGKTGTGKTTLLTSSIYQDMVNGKGLAVLDPHGDMFQELLAIIPEHRRKDVVVFDPSDRAFPVGLNLLDPGIVFADEDEKNERITSSVLSVFAKLADENQWGPRMEHILRNTTMTALQTPHPSLYTLQRLLTDKSYQKTVAEKLTDPVLKQFWEKEFKLLGTMQLSTVTAPLTHRLGHFITTKMTRHILLQEKTTIRVADIMDQGKILLVNLSKGEIGEDQSRFFGTILTSFIWMAAYQRTKIPEKQRRDFFLYVDEFQNFASPDFSDIVSEGRKYRISLVVSHQSIAQIADPSLVKLIAGNASTLICFKVGPEDEAFILPYMKPEVMSGDIVNLAPYHFYMKTTGDVSEDAFSGKTVPLSVGLSDSTRDAVIAESRVTYGMPKDIVEAYMRKLFWVRKPSALPKKPVVRTKGSDKNGN